jgi:hypothetical protein
MSNSRNPLVDPQPGDVVELKWGWERTVIKRTPRKVWFNVQYGRDWLYNQNSGIAQWRRASDLPTARVVRRGDDE